MFAKACFRSSRQWQMYLLLAGWSFPADGALAHSAARQLLGCAACCMSFSGWSCCTSDHLSRQSNLNLPAYLTCLGAKARLNIRVLGEICSPGFHTVQEFFMGKYDSQFHFPWWYFLKFSCQWNPVDILAFASLPLPLCLICKMVVFRCFWSWLGRLDFSSHGAACMCLMSVLAFLNF